MWSRLERRLLRGRAPGLAGRLAIATGVLVGLAVGSMYLLGVGSIRALAGAEALARTEVAASAAREGLRQTLEDLGTAARILGERPTLQRLLTGSIREALVPYLDRYCSGAALDACAVVTNGAVLVGTTGDVDWSRVLRASSEQGERFLVSAALPGALSAGATAAVIEHPGVGVVTLRRLDARVEARLSDRTAATIAIEDYARFQAGDGPLAAVSADALARNGLASAYVAGLDVYAAVLPVTAATGETMALLQARVSAVQTRAAVAGVVQRLWLMALAVAALAVASAVLIGRNWIRAVERLTDAARRLGGGDLAASIPTGGGRELAILGTTMDEMRRNLVALTAEMRKREAEAQAVLGGIIEGVYAVDEHRRIRFLNPQAERLLKISSAEAVGEFCGDVLKPRPDAEGRRPCDYACPIVAARRERAARAVEQIVPVVDAGLRRVVIASAAAAEPGAWQVQVLRDETELEAVRRTRDSVLANISHEFRTPLAAQLASIELLHDGLGRMSADEQRELVSSLQRGTQRLTWLIDNLLESVRIEAGQLGIRHHDVEFDEVVVAARELIEPLIEQRFQRIVVTTDAALPAIRGDQQRLTQVLVNLLANASKFGPPGSEIRLGAQRASGGGLLFFVEDEGAGPDSTDATALFERFRRAGGGKERDESGLGLGLYIVRSIVERHGGSVRLVRTPDGRTRAEVSLRREAPP